MIPKIIKLVQRAATAARSGTNYTALDSRRTFRIGVVADYEPASYPCVAGLNRLEPDPENCTRIGWQNELWSRVLNLLDIPYQLYHIPMPTDWGFHLGNGTYSGALGLLRNGTVDTINCAYTLHPDVITHFDFTYPMKHSTMGLVMLKPGPTILRVALRLITVYSWQFYAVFLLMLLAMGSLVAVNDILFSVNEAADDSQCRQRRNTWRKLNSGYIKKLLTHQEMKYSRNTHDFGKKTRNSLVLMISVSLMIASSVYQGSLLTRLLLHEPIEPISTLEQLAAGINSKTYTLISVSPSEGIYNDIEMAASQPYKLLKAAIRRNPPVFERSLPRLRDRMLAGGGFVYPAHEDYGTEFVKRNCELIYLRMRDAEPKLQGYMFAKNDALLPDVDKAIITFDTYAENRRRIYETFDSVCASSARQNSLLNVQSLSLLSLAGLFVLLMCGLGAALVSLVVELVLARYYADYGTLVCRAKTKRK